MDVGSDKDAGSDKDTASGMGLEPGAGTGADAGVGSQGVAGPDLPGGFGAAGGGEGGSERVTCRLTRSEALTVAAKRYAGPASAVGEAFDHLLRWAEVYNVERWGPLVGVYDDPEDSTARAVQGEAWLPIPPGLTDMESHDPEVRIVVVPAQPIAVCEHRGFPDELGRSMTALVAWIEENMLERSSPVHRQVYREAPKGAPGDWVVEIQIPIVKPAAGSRPETRESGSGW